MIFLILIGIVGIIVIALNMKDNANLEKIENHFKENNCQEIIYTKGSYKGICKDSIMQIPNSFSVDLKEDKQVLKFSDIKQLSKNGKNIIINKEYKFEFKNQTNLDRFYEKVEEELNK